MMDTKAFLKAPCGYLGVNRKGEPERKYPGVDCYYDCDSCGWNPKEAERRMKTGKWITNNGLMSLAFEPLNKEEE